MTEATLLDQTVQALRAQGLHGDEDESLSDADNLPAPELIAAEIVDDLEAALEQFRLIAADLAEDGAAA